MFLTQANLVGSAGFHFKHCCGWVQYSPGNRPHMLALWRHTPWSQ